MLIFFTDETYVHAKEVSAYGLSIYGGLILTEDDISDLTSFLYKIKDNYVLPQELELKWSFVSVWEKMKRVGHIDKSFTKSSHPELYDSLKEDYNKLKNEVIKKVSESSVRIVVAIRPNNLLGGSEIKNIEYSIAAVTKKFKKILESKNEVGIILADELRPKLQSSDTINYQYILKLCKFGFDPSAEDRLLSIVPTIDSCISPIHQINDIVLGALQYYMLQFMKNIGDKGHSMDKARELLGSLVEKFYKTGREGYIINNGILLYPPRNSRQLTRAGIFLNTLEKQLEEDFNIT